MCVALSERPSTVRLGPKWTRKRLGNINLVSRPVLEPCLQRAECNNMLKHYIEALADKLNIVFRPLLDACLQRAECKQHIEALTDKLNIVPKPVFEACP